MRPCPQRAPSHLRATQHHQASQNPGHFLGARSCSRTGVPHVRVLDLDDCGLKRTRLPHLASGRWSEPARAAESRCSAHLERAVFRARVDVALILRNTDGLHRRLVRLECLTRSANISAPKRLRRTVRAQAHLNHPHHPQIEHPDFALLAACVEAIPLRRVVHRCDAVVVAHLRMHAHLRPRLDHVLQRRHTSVCAPVYDSG